MSILQISAMLRDLLLTGLILTLPAVATSLVVGGVISVLQTITSVQEQTLSFAPRIIAVAVVSLVTLPWSLKLASGFTLRMMSHLLEAVR